jgi:hypothetical protein
MKTKRTYAIILFCAGLTLNIMAGFALNRGFSPVAADAMKQSESLEKYAAGTTPNDTVSNAVIQLRSINESWAAASGLNAAVTGAGLLLVSVAFLILIFPHKTKSNGLGGSDAS